jgi:hypothetical protein
MVVRFSFIYVLSAGFRSRQPLGYSIRVKSPTFTTRRRGKCVLSISIKARMMSGV